MKYLNRFNENFITDFFKLDNSKVELMIKDLSSYDYIQCDKIRDFKKSNMGNYSTIDYKFNYDNKKVDLNISYFYPVKSHFSKVNKDGSSSNSKDFKLLIDDKEMNVSSKLIDNLKCILNLLTYQVECLLVNINHDMFNLPNIRIKEELPERFNEFDIIVNGKADLINLNTLYDFYDKPFDKDKVEKIIKVKKFLIESSKFIDSDGKVEDILNQLKDFDLLNIEIESSEKIRLCDYKSFKFNLNGDVIILNVKIEYRNYEPIYHYKLSLNGEVIKEIIDDLETLKGKQCILHDIYSEIGQLITNKNTVLMVISNDMVRKLIINYPETNNPETRIRTGYQLRDEVSERFDEFNIINNGKIDYISLRSLYEFYDIELSEDTLRAKIELKLKE